MVERPTERRKSASVIPEPSVRAIPDDLAHRRSNCRRALDHLPSRPSSLLFGAHLVVAFVTYALPSSAQTLDTPLLTDPGLNSNSQPLLPFTDPELDRWMQENANLVVGVQPDGVAPAEGDGMLALSKAALAATQVRQRIDVTSLARQIDSGSVHAVAFGQANASIAGTVGGTRTSAYNLNQALLSGSGGDGELDGDPGTWEPAYASLELPVGTRFVEHEFQFTNSTLPAGETGYGDAALFVLSEEVLTAVQHLNAQTMLEATASGYRMIQRDLGLDPHSTFQWSGSFDESGWTSSVTGVLYGAVFTLDYSGSSLQLPSGDLEISFVGKGVRGADLIAIAGTALWKADPGSSQFTSMVYDAQGEIEGIDSRATKLKWWQIALEAIGGGIVGGLIGSSGPTVVSTVVGVVVGATAGVVLSQAAINTSTDGGDPPMPPTPPLPDILDWAATADMVLGQDQLLTIVSGDGTLSANLFNEVRLTGTWSEGSASGNGLVSALFSDGFESGDVSRWSSATP